MVVRFDTLDRLEKPTMTLCNPGTTYSYGALSNTVGCLSGTEAEEFVFNFNSISELNFRADLYTPDDAGEALAVQNMYNEIKNRRLVFVDDIGFFVIREVAESHEDGLKYKDIKAESVDSELQQRVVPYIADGTYRLLTSGATEGLLNKIVSTLPLWTIGHVDSSLETKMRTFEDVEVTENCLSFLIDKVQDAYECIILFDTIYRKINVYDQNTYTARQDVQTNIHITEEDVINSVTITEGSEDLYTAMRVVGGDNEELLVKNVNPSGLNVIYDFSYYYNWMSPGLSTKLQTWQVAYDAVAAGKSSDATSSHADTSISQYNYQYLNKQAASLEIEIITLQAESARLAGEVSGFETIMQNIRDESGETPEILEQENELYAETKAERDRVASEKTTVDASITAKQTSYNSYATLINSYRAKYNIFTTTFNTWKLTNDEKAEIQNFIYECDYNDEYSIVTDEMTVADRFEQMEQMLERSRGQLSKVSQPTQEFSVDTEGFLFEKEFKHFSDELQTGCLINMDISEETELDRILGSVSMETYEAEIEDYYSLLGEMEELGANPNRTVYGNIDTNNRQVIEWTAETVAEYYSELESWCSDGETPEDFIGSISTVFGGYEAFDDIDVAFSPILQTQNGGVLLDSDTVMDYIWELIDDLASGQQEWTDNDLIAADRIGLTVDGVLISGLIAAVGSTAAVVSEAMHYTGTYGELRLATPNINEITDTYGIEIEQIITYVNTYAQTHEPMTMFLSSITVNYDDKNMSLTIGNRYNKFDPRSLFDNVLGSVSRSANSVSYIKDTLFPANKRDVDEVRAEVQASRNLTMANALASTDQNVVIDSSGYMGRKVNSDEASGFDPEQVKIVNNAIVFTDDNWATCKAALGKIKIPNPVSGEQDWVYGLSAEALIGNLVLTQNLRVENDESSIILDKDGMTYDYQLYAKPKAFDLTMETWSLIHEYGPYASYYSEISLGKSIGDTYNLFSAWFGAGYSETKDVFVRFDGEDEFFKLEPVVWDNERWLVYNYSSVGHPTDSSKPAFAVHELERSGIIVYDGKTKIWTSVKPQTPKTYGFFYEDEPTGTIITIDNEGVFIEEKSDFSTRESEVGIVAFFANLFNKVKSLFGANTDGLFDKVGFRIQNLITNDQALMSSNTIAFQDGTDSDNISYYGIDGAKTKNVSVTNSVVVGNALVADNITSSTTHFYPDDTMTIQNLPLCGDVTKSGTILRFAVPLDRLMDSALVDIATINSMSFSIRGVNGYIGFLDSNNVEHKPDSSNSHTLQYNSSTTYMSLTVAKSTNNMLLINLTGQNGLTHVTNNTPVTLFCSSMQITFTKSRS